MQKVYWLAAIALIVFTFAALVVPYLQKMSSEEDALESVVQDIARVYFADGVEGVRVLCGVRPLMEAHSLNYRCRIRGGKITVEQFVASARRPIVLRKKDIPRRGRLEATQKEASVL